LFLSCVPSSFLLALLFHVSYLCFSSSKFAVCIFFTLFLLSSFLSTLFPTFPHRLSPVNSTNL
jgi:hypothetical protein